MNKVIDVTINTPDKILWQGTALSVSSINSAGPFDILAFHANFVTLIENKPIIIRTESGQDIKYQFLFSILYAHQNKVNIYSNLTPSSKQISF